MSATVLEGRASGWKVNLVVGVNRWPSFGKSCRCIRCHAFRATSLSVRGPHDHAVSGGQPEYIPLLGQAPVATKLRAVLKELVAVQSALAVRTVEPASPVADSPFHFSGVAFLFRPFEVSKVENTRISRNLDAHSPSINRALLGEIVNHPASKGVGHPPATPSMLEQPAEACDIASAMSSCAALGEHRDLLDERLTPCGVAVYKPRLTCPAAGPFALSSTRIALTQRCASRCRRISASVAAASKCWLTTLRMYRLRPLTPMTMTAT